LKNLSKIMLILGTIGSIDAVYLTLEAVNPNVPLFCPAASILNCTLVTSSAFSRFFGIPVAVLGLLWFVAIIGLYLLPGHSEVSALLVPLWVIGMIFVVYLVFVELFVIGSICAYCTIAHIVGASMGFPVLKLALGED
jgi:uncharacterized membrane protein